VGVSQERGKKQHHKKEFLPDPEENGKTPIKNKGKGA